MLLERDFGAGEAVIVGRLARCRAAGRQPVQSKTAVEAAHAVGGAVLVKILAVVINVERRIALGVTRLDEEVDRLGFLGFDERDFRLSGLAVRLVLRSEEHTSELQSLMRISYAVFCLKKKKHKYTTPKTHTQH